MRDTERERGRDTDREKQAPCREPDVELDPRTPGIMPWAEGRRSTAELPGLPLSCPILKPAIPCPGGPPRPPVSLGQRGSVTLTRASHRSCRPLGGHTGLGDLGLAPCVQHPQVGGLGCALPESGHLEADTRSGPSYTGTIYVSVASTPRPSSWLAPFVVVRPLAVGKELRHCGRQIRIQVPASTS